MNLSSTLCSTFLLLSFVGHAKVTPDVTVNQVLSTLLEWKKPNIVKSANRRFARKEFHRGTFFKGEIAPAKKVASKLAKANPQVLETPRGFAIVVQAQEKKLKVEIEFVDMLRAQIKVSGKTLQLSRGMSSLQVVRAIAPPILASLTLQLKSKKTSLISFIPRAWADDEQIDPEMQKLWEFIRSAPLDAAKVGAKIGTLGGVAVSSAVGAPIGGAIGGLAGGLLGGPFGAYKALKEGKKGAEVVDAATWNLISLAERGAREGAKAASSVTRTAGIFAGLPLGATIGLTLGTAASVTAAILLGTSIIIDTAATELEYLFTDKDEKMIRKAKKHLDGMIGACQERRKQYYHQDDQGKMTLKNKAISQLQGEGWKNFQEFQVLSELSSRLQSSFKRNRDLPGARLKKRKDSTMMCHQLVKRDKDVNKLKRTREKNYPTAALLTFQSKIIPLCESYGKIIECFTSIPRPFGEKEAVSVSAIKGSGRTSVFDDLLSSFEEVAEERGVLQ